MLLEDRPLSLRAQSEAPSVQVLLGQWRGRILRRLLLVGSVLATLASAIFGYQQAALGAWTTFTINVMIVLTLWVTTLSRGLSDPARIKLTLTVLYLGSALGLFTMGLCAESILGLSGFVALSSLLVGFRWANWAFCLVLGTIAACATSYVNGWLTLPAVSPVEPSNPWNWVRSGLFASSIITAIGGGTSYLLKELVNTLTDRTELIKQLREEANQRERTHRQLAETQERLLHAHKLEVVGRLAGGIAHDFNNTLTVILSYGELIKSRLGRESPYADLADQIIQAAEQGGDLTKQLLTFTRRQIVKPRTVDVQQILRNTERALTRLVPRSIHIKRAEVADELYVLIDPTQLQQAILNLALNARDAMAEAGGELTLEAGLCDVSERDGLPIVAGQYVTVRVRDTGTGMGDDTLARLFEPFFTTKEPGLGTGLGLANVRETTDAAGGHVSVKSELGKGSQLTLYFPRADAHISGIESTQPPALARQNKLLVVDDEPQIRDVIRTMLVDSGYDVRVADSARAALAVLAETEVDLICTDMVMPEMSGAKLIDELRRTRPDLPVVVCSAYGTDDDVSRRVARGEVFFLSKPFTRKDLLGIVNRALSARSNGRPRAAG
ncbi:MAG: response regulator [Polyangiales bacterium]